MDAAAAEEDGADIPIHHQPFTAPQSRGTNTAVRYKDRTEPMGILSTG